MNDTWVGIKVALVYCMESLYNIDIVERPFRQFCMKAFHLMSICQNEMSKRRKLLQMKCGYVY